MCHIEDDSTVVEGVICVVAVKQSNQHVVTTEQDYRLVSTQTVIILSPQLEAPPLSPIGSLCLPGVRAAQRRSL